MLILRNCKLIPELTEGTDLTTADIVINEDKIEQIVPCGTAVEGEYEEMDLQGKTLMPGMIDAHVHLHMGKSDPWNTGDRLAVPGRRVLDCLRYAQFFLDLGFTTVRDVGDEVHFPTVAVRNAINEGEFVGPRIVCSGVTIAPETAGFETSMHMLETINDANDMRRVVRRQFAMGADMIKLYGTGSMMVVDSLPGRRLLEEDEVREAVAIATRKDSYCACHCHGAEAIGVMIDCGVKTIEHASFITDESCKKLDGRTDIGIVPTLACSCKEMNILDGHDESEIERYAAINAQRDVCLNNAYQNYNILMGWGTDFSIDSHAKAPDIEWRERVRMGWSSIDILKQATVNSAILMGMDDKIGTVKAGKLADLVVVDGDPVADITIMYKKPAHVIKGGTLIR